MFFPLAVLLKPGKGIILGLYGIFVVQFSSGGAHVHFIVFCKHLFGGQSHLISSPENRVPNKQ